MNKKNYKTNLKKSFIICGVMFAIILLIFVFSTFVNKNVAENMTGKMLYMNESNSIAELSVYDFDEEKSTAIKGLEEKGTIKSAQFLKDESIGIALLNKNELKIVLYKNDTSDLQELTSIKDVEGLISFEADSRGEKILLCIKKIDKSASAQIINCADGLITEVFVTDKDVSAVCFNENCDRVYSSVNGKNTLIYSSNMKLEFSIKGKAQLIGAWENGFLLSRKDEYEYIYKFFTSSERENKLKFCEDHNTYSICLITKDKFIAGSDKSGNGDIYICNGSNMDPVEQINDDCRNVPLDYMETNKK